MVGVISFSLPTEGIRHEQSSTKLLINGRSVGNGTLYIAESALSWYNESINRGYTFLYPSIGLHGVTRESPSLEGLFLMIDASLDGSEAENSDDENDSNNANTELRFIPEDKSQLDAMYQALTECQNLHPDPEYIPSDDDLEFHDAYENGENLLAGGDSGFIELHANSDGTNGLHQSYEADEMETDGQFDDVED